MACKRDLSSSMLVDFSGEEKQQNRLSTQPPKDDTFVLVAAIDFGTTFSGYAFSFCSSPDDIRMFKDWGANVALQGYKTPTVVLTDKNGIFVDFGYDAESKFADFTDGEDRDYCLYSKFKMVLHRISKLSRTTNITARNGQIRPAIQVFAMALKYLKEHMLDIVNRQAGQHPDLELIRWVITVPAIWSDASKQFMREAAVEAGIIDKAESTRLMIALEPEAASLWCRTLEVDHFTHKGEHGTMDPGTKYLVLDAGGGTLDVTVHQLKESGQVRELHQASGGALGGLKVDENFHKLLEQVFGKDVILYYKDECPADWLQLMCNFERKKRSLRPDDRSTVNIQIPYQFGEVYHQVAGKSVKDACKGKMEGVSFKQGMLVLSNEVMKGLFRPCVEGIIQHVDKLLQEPGLEGITYALMVGGFSEAQILQEAVKQHFGGRLKVLVPNDASLCVIKGAVLFGHQPHLISTRVARRTYGIKCQRAFNPAHHAIEKRRMVNGVAKCIDLFDPIVCKGDEIEIGTVKTLNFTPSRADQRGADILIYGCEKSTVKYITDEGVEQLGHIFINLSGEGKDRSIRVSITFGGPELYVEVRDMNNPDHNAGRMNIQFLVD